MSKNKFIPFEVNNIPLEGTNLVEASAGTGKTYSIALLMLRLLVEKDISLKEILLVTFTNAATAELEERIRIFVREAHDFVVSETEASDPIKEIIQNAIDKNGREKTKQQLKDALLFLDELSVMTIHGFCMQTLTNHAFETGQLFGSELTTAIDELLITHVQQFWRNHVTTLPLDILKMLLKSGLSIASIQCVIKDSFAGKKFYLFDRKKKYSFDTKRAEELVQKTSNSEEKKEALLEKFKSLLEKNTERIINGLSADRFGKEHADDVRDSEVLLSLLKAKRDKKYIIKIFEPTGILDVIDSLEEIENEILIEYTTLVGELYCYAIQEVSIAFKNHLLTNGVLSFNDLIKNLHIALCGENKEKIAKALQKEYKAVFIDEFQDTDKLQYEIFNTAFEKDVILFYIGDPKQSIYSFRQADINTYFKAYNEVDHRYSMNINFRSSEKMIEAMNRFFLPNEDFDTFHFGDSKEKIGYIDVKSPKINAKGNLIFRKETNTPITIYNAGNKPAINEQTALLVYELLTNDQYFIECGEKKNKIEPSDIGILVRSNKDGIVIKNQLNNYNIPAVVMTEEKIMETQQAKELYFVLQAIYEPVSEKLNSSLVNSFTGYSNEDALKFNHEFILDLFKKYKLQWQTEGIYSCITSYIKDFGIKEHLTHVDTPNGLRIITNLNQLTELLFKTEYHKKLKQAELLDWLKRAMSMEVVEKDESTIRLENDAEAVNIVTIHKSKGLQYKIVIVPHFDFQQKIKKNKTYTIYENEEYINYPGIILSDEQKEIYLKQQEQENRRLMYVAVTRAVYKCFLFRNNSSQCNGSGFSSFVAALKNEPALNEKLVEISLEIFPLHNKKFSLIDPKKKIKKPGTVELSLKDTDWQFMSYSSLVANNDEVIKFADIADESKNDYDEFVFSTLRKGAITGNMLHAIFEKIDFGNSRIESYLISRAVESTAPGDRVAYQKYLPELVDHVLKSNIKTESGNFQLSDISNGQKLHEMEFDFSVGQLIISDFEKLIADAEISIQLKSGNDLKGMMNGFIDLFFEYNGKYYVLDWKSNYLGNSLENYSQEGLQAAMNAFNYNLQYLIYSVAVKRFLTKHLGYFTDEIYGGVIYCFVRGMREGKSTGVYFNKPDLKLLQQLDSLLLDKESVQNL